MDGKPRLGLTVALLLGGMAACSNAEVIGPFVDDAPAAAAASPAVGAGASQADDQACWGQASRVLAAAGLMGDHASYYDTPRLGLRNLARQLYELGLIEDDSIQALGRFVSVDVEACL